MCEWNWPCVMVPLLYIYFLSSVATENIIWIWWKLIFLSNLKVMDFIFVKQA